MKETINNKTGYFCVFNQRLSSVKLKQLRDMKLVAGVIGHQPAATSTLGISMKRGEVLFPACTDPTPGSANHFLQAKESNSYISSHPEFTDNSQSAPATKHLKFRSLTNSRHKFKFFEDYSLKHLKVREITQ